MGNLNSELHHPRKCWMRWHVPVVLVLQRQKQEALSGLLKVQEKIFSLKKSKVEKKQHRCWPWLLVSIHVHTCGWVSQKHTYPYARTHTHYDKIIKMCQKLAACNDNRYKKFKYVTCVESLQTDITEGQEGLFSQ